MSRTMHVAILGAALLLSVRLLPAQDKGLGIGVIIGEPTGFSMKSWLSPTTAVAGAAAWSFSKGTSLQLHADYLIHSFNALKSQERIPLYYGIGGRIKTADKGDARLGARGVIGLDYMARRAPIDVFVEIAPILDILPSVDLSINAGFGVRYFFR